MQKRIVKEKSTNNFVSKDLAIIIPTKNRPKEIKRLLKSIRELDSEVGRVIVVASGEDIFEIVMKFSDKLPIEYYLSSPGQIKQRNKGISLLDDSTKLVATIDDDATFYKNSISEIIKFWNNSDVNTGGVGFNIVNIPRHKHSFLKGILGLSVPEPGKVLKSGMNTPITNVNKNIRSEYLNGGATVWRQDILKHFQHHEVKSKWSAFEDLIFSYPIGKKYNLYISKDSLIEIENNIKKDEGPYILMYRAKTHFIWGAYFVNSFSEMSIFSYLYFKLIQLIATLIKSLKNKNKLFEVLGMINGLFLILPSIFGTKNLTNIIEENT